MATSAPIEDFTPKCTAGSDILAEDAISLADRSKNEALGKSNFGLKVDLHTPYRESQYFKTKVSLEKRSSLTFLKFCIECCFPFPE